MSIHSQGARLAAAAATLALSAGAFAAANQPGSSGLAVAASDKVHCYGVNECKGQNDCKTAQSACKGNSACKGQGFKGTTAKSCLEQGGTIADLLARK
ncbi:MAG: hypothetical protein H0W40_01165 [Methylibium sp.]|nr:hypothetical protein [Methylibium sp.]MBA3595984.1 hypothetical protein [Methylibium sp.]